MEKVEDSKEVEPQTGKALPAAARRALAEAAEWRKQAEAASAAKRPKEIGGPSGPEPTRYGDWEKKGIVTDF